MSPELRPQVIDFAWEGGTGNDAFNNTSLLSDILATAGTSGALLRVPPGIYRTDPVDISTAVRIEVDGPVGSATFKARTADQPYVLQLKAATVINGLRVDCANTAIDGVVLQNGRSSLSNMLVTDAKAGYGFRFDLAYGGGAGNINLSHLTDCEANGNNHGLVGFAVPTFGSDHNGIVLENCRSHDHTSHGALLKGHNWRVEYGNYFSNDGYGIQVGEGTSETFSQSPVLVTPWLEANTLGGVNFQRSTKGLHIAQLVGGIDADIFTRFENVAIAAATATGGGDGVLRIQSGTDAAWIELNNDEIKLAGGTDTNRDLQLMPKGTGGVRITETGARIYSGTGSPAGVLAAGIGSIFLRTDGGAATSLYVKESGTGTSGWVGK